ncbi:MAG: mitochondrial fission ELM1 family protein [Methylohalobius sp.]|nr:mitochondrial fission ELM1 family protein [Methylohalobius sp.]
MEFMLNNEFSQDAVPKVWVLLNHRAGENAQVLALAEALGWPFAVKRFAYRRGVPYLLLGASLAGIDRQRSDSLTPPWPDLVISASARNEPICLWIQKQAAKAGKQVKLVHIGRPWKALKRFDLIITTPQYRLPMRPNVLHNATTLHRVTPERLAQEQKRWGVQLAQLPAPRIAVLIGGSSGPYVLDRAAALQLAKQANELAANAGGSLLVTTSARTSDSILEAFASQISVPAHLFCWAPGQSNPYYAYLALADQIIVTSDSVSMLSEACATGKPVYIFDLDRVERKWEDLTLEHFFAFIYRMAMRWAPKRLTRDLAQVHARLIGERRAMWLGEVFPSEPASDSSTAMMWAVRRVRSLFELGVPAEKDRGEFSRSREAMNPAFS